MITLNVIERRLSEFAANHYFVQGYGFGSPDEVDLDKFQAFPLLYVVYTGADYPDGAKTYNLEVYLFDRPTEQEAKSTNRREVVSDSEQCLEDLIADITNGFNVFQFDEAYNVDAANVTPIIDERTNTLSGALLDLSISVPYDRSACNLPLDGVSPEGGEITYARRGLLRMLTQDGTTDVTSVNTIRVTNGTLTDEGNGVVSLDITGGTGAVDSVNGQTGTVVLDTDDIPEGATNQYYTNTRVQTYLEGGEVDQINFIDKAVLTWNADKGTLNVTFANGVSLQLGQEQHVYAKAYEAIPNGAAVMFAGAQGSHILVRKADMAVPGFIPEWVIGIATQAFTVGSFGYVATFGDVNNLDTSTYAEGTILYLDPDTPGGYVTAQPIPPDHIIFMGSVTRSNANVGVIFTRWSHKPDTNEVPEGTTNLYYTDARVDARVTALRLATEGYVDLAVGAEESARITADNGLQSQINTVSAGVSTNAGNIATNTAAIDALEAADYVQSVNSQTPTAGNVSLTTTNVPEGTNEYYTAAKVDARIGAADLADLNNVPAIGTPGQALVVDGAGTGHVYTTISGTGAVDSVNGQTGVVVLDSDDISEGVTNLYFTSAERTKLTGIAAGAEVNVNADWNAVSGDAQILNKPTIPAQFFGVTSNGNTAITLDTGDEGRYIRCTASTAVTVTVPSGKFQADDEILIEQAGTGQVTVSAGAGVTLNNSSANTTKTAERYAVVALKCVATDVFTLTGERELV